MSRMLAASTIAASLLLSPAGFGWWAMAADENGSWRAAKIAACVEFLQFSKDEQAARAKVSSPDIWVAYDSRYRDAVLQIWAMISGFNLGHPNVVDVLPGQHPLTQIELVRRKCDSEPTLYVADAVREVIFANYANWQRSLPKSVHPAN